MSSADNVPADFIATHAYGVTQGFLDKDGTSGTVLDPSPDAVSGRMRRSRELLAQSGRPQMELHFYGVEFGLYGDRPNARPVPPGEFHPG